SESVVPRHRREPADAFLGADDLRRHQEHALPPLHADLAGAGAGRDAARVHVPRRRVAGRDGSPYEAVALEAARRQGDEASNRRNRRYSPCRLAALPPCRLRKGVGMPSTIPGTWDTTLSPAMIAQQRTVSAPRLSPDGRHLAFACEYDGRTDLFVVGE